MKSNDYDQKQIKAYLEGRMPAAELRAFEAGLGRDARLQKAVVQQGLAMSSPAAPAEEAVRTMADEVRRQLGSLPEPRLSLLDRLRYALAEWRPWQAGLALATLALLLLTTVANLTLKPTGPQQIGEYFIEAYCPGVAGEESVAAAEAQFYRAARFYCGIESGGLDSLNYMANTCADFCMARYFRGHWLLKAGQYPEALQDLAVCMEYQQELNAFYNTQDTSKIRLNYLLARLGTEGPGAALKAELLALGKDPGASTSVREAAAQLHRSMSNPLRWLVIGR